MANSLTRDDVADIARLARLELSADELDSLQSELATILDHIAVLQSLDTDGVEPMTHAVPMDLRLRGDEVQPSLPVEVALGGAPEQAEDHFEVPNIIPSGSASSGSESSGS
ncbi:MAG: Asp-tRNA(Asn)/Glu-tRNA(Gln) amidotransferase subunit GatC [Myxococcota bacterium]